MAFMRFRSLWSKLFGCPHTHVGWPQRGTQRCMACASYRVYRLGAQPGPWKHGDPLAAKRRRADRKRPETVSDVALEIVREEYGVDTYHLFVPRIGAPIPEVVERWMDGRKGDA
jgi:hypothetical protein